MYNYNLVMSPMEHVFTTEYIKDMIMDNLTIKELNHIRACSKGLQDVISKYSEQKMIPYLYSINRKVTQLRQDNLNTIYEMPYIIIYNYYHTIIKYSCLILSLNTHIEFQKLMECLRAKKIIHLGHKYVFDTDKYNKTDIGMHSYSLFDIMTGIYLYNTGRDWASYHWSEEGLDQMKYLQGKLLPSS